MAKRILPLLLAFTLVLAIMPSAAQASVLSGWTSKVDYENTDPARYAVEIDVTNQVITVYDYTIGGNIVLQSLCTTGSEKHPTGTGTFKMGTLKERFGYFVAFGQYAQYWSQVTRGIYIHSVMYSSTKLTSMSKSAYRDLGKNVSHGCVRVLPHIAQWIFYNCPPGTVCKVTKKLKDDGLVKSIKASIPSYKNYVQPVDNKPSPSEIPAVIRFDNTPLRTGSSTTNDRTIGYLNAGERAVLLQLGVDWCKLKTQDGKLGYVKSKYILAYPDAAVERGKLTVAGKKTYVYATASTKAKTLVRIPSGAQVTLLSRHNDSWWLGSFNGVEGYIRNKYVKTVTDYIYPTLDSAVQYTEPSAPSGSTGIFGSGSSGAPASGGYNAGGSTSKPQTQGSSTGIFGQPSTTPQQSAEPIETPRPAGSGIFG